jgi:hypothetical protein
MIKTMHRQDYYYIFGFVGVAILLSIVIAGIYYVINNTGTYSKIMRNHSYWCMK